MWNTDDDMFNNGSVRDEDDLEEKEGDELEEFFGENGEDDWDY